jgi:hypothetical protein
MCYGFISISIFSHSLKLLSTSGKFVTKKGGFSRVHHLTIPHSTRSLALHVHPRHFSGDVLNLFDISETEVRRTTEYGSPLGVSLARPQRLPLVLSYTPSYLPQNLHLLYDRDTEIPRYCSTSPGFCSFTAKEVLRGLRKKSKSSFASTD